MENGPIRTARHVGVLIAAGALLAGVSVGLSAYAAHAVDGAARSALQTAAVFGFGHGIVLVVLGRAVRGTLELVSLLALLVGTCLFAGALVSRHLFGGPAFFAPWGGLLTMAGWLLQAVAAFRR